MAATEGTGGPVLIGFDGSEHAQDAARFAGLLAGAIGTDIQAVHVQVRPTGEDNGLKEPDEAGDLGDGEPLRVRVVEAKSAAAGLYAVAEAEAPAMLVVGTTHQHGIGKLLHGSVPGRLLAGLSCPLVVVPAGYVAPGRVRVIEVGFDASDESTAALAFAAQLGDSLGATLRVVAAAPPLNPNVAAAGVGIAEHLEKALRGAVAELPSDLRALPIFSRSKASAELLAKADEGVDLIVLGSRSYGPLHSVLLGSVSTAVIERASCPVLITPRPALSGTS